MATESENRRFDIDVEAPADFDELAARAGAAMRRPAPEHGVEDAVRRGQRRRVVTALAAGSVTIVLVVVGVAVLRDSSDTAPDSPVVTTPVDHDGDSTIARAALISVDQLGPGWSPEAVVTPTAWEEWRAATGAQPECADYTAATQPIEITAAGAAASYINLQNQIAGEDLTIYPSKDAASRVMDALDAGGFEPCFLATWDTANAIGFPGSKPTTTSFNLAAPLPHGDRQIDFGMRDRCCRRTG